MSNPSLGDAAARERAIGAPGSVLVQAPAGSGKTTLLAQRYLRLLGSVESPERILALTFTRRAAQEMRERVMSALQAGGDSCPDGMNARTWELGRAAHRHMAGAGIDVERHPARLRIETIDSFNAWLAGQLPITAGAGSRLALVEKAQDLYREAARRALAHEEADVYGNAVDRVLALDDQRWQTLVALIADMLPSRDRWLPLLAGTLDVMRVLDADQLQRVRRHLDEDLELLVSRTLRGAEESIGRERLASLSLLVHGAARRCAGLRTDLVAWETDAKPLRGTCGDMARWRGAAALLLTEKAAYRKRLTKNDGFPPACVDKPVMLELLIELDRNPHVLRGLVEIRALPNPAYDDEQWGRVREVAQVLVLAAAQLADVFREEGVVDFPAVSLAALRALGTATEPTDLSLRLDYRLQHILVDEFQDTSSAQLELVKLLTAGWQRGDGRSIFCVGDPMQSIYGFRQAEVRAFLELAEDGIGDIAFDVQRLTSNFRSSPVLVDWLNAVFSRILPRRDDRERGAIAFRPSSSAVQAAVPDAAVELRGFAHRRDEALAIAEAIATQLQRHPGWRVAVLVRARTHARDIAACLRLRDVAFRAVEIEPLQDRPVVRDLVMLVRALRHPADRTAWLAVLRAPWAGVTLADLLVVARGAPVIWDALQDAVVRSLLSADGGARCARLCAVFEAAFQVRGATSLTRWVERVWLALGGPGCASGEDALEDARRVFVRLGELEERGMPDASQLSAGFADLYAVNGAPAAVEIMTIHKSKGLEFDMVVVPALDRHIPVNRDQLLLSHEFARAERDGLVMAARPGVGQADDDLFEFLRFQTRDAASLEAERLLYVACTRAKWRLHLTATIGQGEESEDAPAEWHPRAGSLLNVLWPVVGTAFAVDPSVGAAGPHHPLLPQGGPLLRVPAHWSPGIEEVLSAGEATETLLEVREETPVFDWAGETARRVGSLVHAELQVMDLDISETTIRARDGHFRQWLSLHGVPTERLEGASARVIAALLAVRRDPRGRWVLKAGYRESVREHALSGRWRNEVVRVVFDRSFIDDDGVRWVVDYKTSQHGGGDLEEFLRHEVERYRAQMERYAHFARLMGPQPVRVGLYFPLIGAWREWEP